MSKLNDHTLKVIAQEYGRSIKTARTKVSIVLTPEQKQNFLPKPAPWRKVLHWLGEQNENK